MFEDSNKNATKAPDLKAVPGAVTIQSHANGGWTITCADGGNMLFPTMFGAYSNDSDMIAGLIDALALDVTYGLAKNIAEKASDVIDWPPAEDGPCDDTGAPGAFVAFGAEYVPPVQIIGYRMMTMSPGETIAMEGNEFVYDTRVTADGRTTTVLIAITD